VGKNRRCEGNQNRGVAVTPLIILFAIFGAILVGSIVLLILLLAFRPEPQWKSHGYQPLAMPGPEPAPRGPKVAQMPVVEAGCVSYQWINLTGIEDE
jgi:hypothetical protein